MGAQRAGKYSGRGRLEFRSALSFPTSADAAARSSVCLPEAFHPRSRLRPDLDPRQLFNISLGLPVSEYPIIDAAFLFVGTDPEAMPMRSSADFCDPLLFMVPRRN